jgi:hypothetical protein
MATLFLDFENGNDNYGGSSFALLASGTNGRITTATFSSTGASFPNDGSLIGQYLSIFNGTIYAVYNITAWVSATSLTIAAISGGTALANQAVDRQYYIGGRWKNITTGATAVRTIPGDTIRIMGSPAPTSLGQNGVWTSQTMQALKSISSSTNATPIAVTVTAHGYATGDTVVITGHTTNTNANGTWKITNTGANTFTLDDSVGNGVGGATGSVRLRNNTHVRLASAVTQNIASTGPGRAAWTAVAGGNITIALDTAFFKEHRDSDSIAIAAGFTTGLAAYWPTGTIDLSGYQQVSFWIRQTTGITGAAGAVDLRLCSDAAGVTAVNTINIPNLARLGYWMPVTVDLGTNLGSSIQSIALYVNTDNGAQTFLLNNIIACKASSAADSLTLTSLIGKNTTGETFWGIQSINGTRVMLDAETNATPTSTTVRGYYGTSETVTTWKRETIKLGPAVSFFTALQTIQESGTDGSPITYSGGWDRTAMSTQNLETWLDGQNGNGTLISMSNLNWISFSKISASRFNSTVTASSSRFLIFSFGTLSNCATGLDSSLATGPVAVEVNFSIAHTDNALSLPSDGKCTAVVNYFVGSSNRAIDVGGARGCVVKGGTASALIANCGQSPFTFNGSLSEELTIQDIQINTGNTLPVFSTLQNATIYIVNCDTDYSPVVSFSSWKEGIAYIHKDDKSPTASRILMEGATILTAVDQRNTASGVSWKIQPTSTTVRNAFRPVVLSLAKVACAANSLVTIKAWMRRDNSGLTMRLVCKGGQIAGVTSDVVSALTTTNAWEEETITFTPTETGVVEITAEAWGGTTFSGWVDDMTISQA